ncbi:hypothetical protein [Piscinibacter sp. XHJ-5]|uniref:EF-hand domain-containing protein n=1 Tax=Piscinibacter sp. XHJ-5 TaxID=3037797 RepID=UPI002453228B|nr:hypothetical protein [Piscinibacter sp. XHJ-5]
MRRFRLDLIVTVVLSSTCVTVAAQERSTPRITDERARQIARAMDRNGDGVVSWSEFETAMAQSRISVGSRSAPAGATEPATAHFWERLDSNRDGVLDASEIKAGMPAPYTIR